MKTDQSHPFLKENSKKDAISWGKHKGEILEVRICYNDPGFP